MRTRTRRAVQYDFHNKFQAEQNEYGSDKINVKFISNCPDEKQTYKGNLLFWKGTQCKSLFKSCFHITTRP